MNLKEYFAKQPYGAKKEMAEALGITPTWLGLILRGARKPSAYLAKQIEKVTEGRVSAAELRPDLFD